MKINYKGFMREMIQRNPVTISPGASFLEARTLTHKKGIRHLPVVDKDNRVVGIVTDADIRKAAPSDATTLSIYELNYLLDKLKVSAFMTPKDKLITITPDTLIEEAVKLMRDHKIGVFLFWRVKNFMGSLQKRMPGRPCRHFWPKTEGYSSNRRLGR